MKTLLILEWMLLLFGRSKAFVISGSKSFTFETTLNLEGTLHMKWTPMKDAIIIQLEAKTQGYIGFGVSPDGEMTNADILLAYFDDNGQPQIKDMFAFGREKPEMDESQDFVLENARRNDSHLVFTFSRKWITCDDKDVAMNADSNNLIWALSDTTPEEEDGKIDFEYHGLMRGTKFIFLNSSISYDRSGFDDAKVWEFSTAKIYLNESKTFYSCSIVKFPEIEEKHQIIGYEPILTKENIKFAHHLILYKCNVEGYNKEFYSFLNKPSIQCYTRTYPKLFQRCRVFTIIWAIGTEGYAEPKHTGMPIEADQDHFYRFEVHFDNSARVPDVITQLGFRIFYTNRLRTYDSDIFGLGELASSGPLLMIPPGENVWKVESHCDTSCFNWSEHGLKNGINIYAVNHHTHLLGKKIFVQHIRNGVELEMLTKDTAYNFAIQKVVQFREEKKILPGDQLLTTCFYNSSKLAKPTYGGLETSDEMCLVHLRYYPAMSYKSCYTMIPPTVYNELYDITIKKKGSNFFRPQVDTSSEKGIPFQAYMGRPGIVKADALRKAVSEKGLMQYCDFAGKRWVKTIERFTNFKKLPQTDVCNP